LTNALPRLGTGNLPWFFQWPSWSGTWLAPATDLNLLPHNEPATIDDLNLTAVSMLAILAVPSLFAAPPESELERE
jgi:hypothetical protein